MAEVKMVVEGVYSAKAAMRLAQKYEVELPIIEQVNEVLFHGKPAAAAVKDLMIRDKKRLRSRMMRTGASTEMRDHVLR